MDVHVRAQAARPYDGDERETISLAVAPSLASMIGPIAVYLYLITVRGRHPFPAIGYGPIVSLGLHLIVNPFTKPEPEEHLNRIFGKISPK